MSLFRRHQRALSYQSIWGSGGDWEQALDKVGLLKSVTQPTVYRCCMIVAGMVAQMSPRVMSNAGTARAMVTPEPRFIASPSNVFSAYEWRFAGTVSMLIAGEQTGLILGEDAAGYPTTVEWVWPERFDVTDNGIGRRPSWRLDGQQIDPSKVWHRRNFAMPGKVRGVDPLSQAGLLETAKAAREFGRQWFEEGAVPSQIIKSARELTQQEADQTKTRFVQAARRRRPVVVPDWITVEPQKVTAEESQFLETQREAKSEIANVLGVPAEMIGVGISGRSVTYANRDQRIQDLLVTTLNHYATVWNDALTDALPRPQYVRLNPGVILRSDLMTRMQAYATAAQVQQATGIRVYTEDEIRDLEDREPLPDASDAGTARELAEVIQKVYLGVGKVITADEAREIVNLLGAGLDLPGPFSGGANAA